MSAADYGNYNEWKVWEEKSFFEATPFEAHYFCADFEGIDLNGKAFLEIGFGNGAMLAWAKSMGAAVVGNEILESALERAANRGIELIRSLEPESIAAYEEHFDVVAAYDVFEHLTIPQLSEMLKAIASMLKPGGKLVIRFPNGQSPFGLMLQNADHTHRSVLSHAIINQLVTGTTLRITKVTGGKQVPHGSLLMRLGLRVKRGLRQVTEWYLRQIFDLDCELAVNLVMVLTKRP